MYEKYERRRADNITDPEERLQKPISMISGWEKQSQKSENSPSTELEDATSSSPQATLEVQKAIEKAETAEEEVIEEIDGENIGRVQTYFTKRCTDRTRTFKQTAVEFKKYKTKSGLLNDMMPIIGVRFRSVKFWMNYHGYL